MAQTHHHLEDAEQKAEVEPCGSEEGSYLRLIDVCSLNSRLESNREEEEEPRSTEEDD